MWEGSRGPIVDRRSPVVALTEEENENKGGDMEVKIPD
jgi:hypothetical protein